MKLYERADFMGSGDGLAIPVSWQKRIKSMVDHQQRANAMRTELEQYLVGVHGLVSDSFDSGCILEDTIIDTMNYDHDFENLISRIDEAIREKIGGDLV